MKNLQDPTIIFILIFMTLTVHQVICFDCSSLIDRSFCEAYGCIFLSGFCTGTFTPLCNFYFWFSLFIIKIGSGTCFYVEANAPITSGDGTLAAPYSNITDALRKISTVQIKNADYNVVILPKSHEDNFHLIGTITYNMQMKISI